MKKCFVVLNFVFFLAACGFEPLYAQKKQSGGWYFGGDFDTSVSDEMAQIRVEPIEQRFGQLIRNELIDNLTPLGVPSHPKYRLSAQLAAKQISQQAMRDDITATREQVKYTVIYTLSAGDEELVRGDSIAYVSYDMLANPYSTTMAQKKTETDAAKIIANDIALRIGAYFHSKVSKRGTAGAI